MTASCGTNDRNTDKGEVGGSSPPRPTIQIASKYAAILTFPLSGNISQKPFCQKSAKSPSRLQLPVRVRAATYCELSKAAMYCFRDPAARSQPKCKASPRNARNYSVSRSLSSLVTHHSSH
jgi:hypothetical protein